MEALNSTTYSGRCRWNVWLETRWTAAASPEEQVWRTQGTLAVFLLYLALTSKLKHIQGITLLLVWRTQHCCCCWVNNYETIRSPGFQNLSKTLIISLYVYLSAQLYTCLFVLANTISCLLPSFTKTNWHINPGLAALWRRHNRAGRKFYKSRFVCEMRNIWTVCLKDWVLDQGPFLQTVSVISWIDPMDLVKVQNNHWIIRIQMCKCLVWDSLEKKVSYLS